MPARTQSGPIQGSQELLKLAKPGQSGQPVFTTIGCLEKFDKTTTKDTLDISCRQFSGKVASGKPAQMAISAEGYRYIYIGADIAASVSIDELQDYTKQGLVLAFQHSTYQTGDKIYTQNFVIKEAKLTAENDSIEKWTISLESSGDEVVTTAA